jgi:hypothetical protein
MNIDEWIDIILQKTNKVNSGSRLTELKETVLIARGWEGPVVVILWDPIDIKVGWAVTKGESERWALRELGGLIQSMN